MGRSYADPSYGARHLIRTVNYTAGTRATAIVESLSIMHPITVTDWQMLNTTLGTGGSSQWVLAATSSYGTSALGTIIFVGTHAANVTIEGSVTETRIAAGGSLNLYSVLSTAAGLTVEARIEYKETFDNTDTD